MGRVNDRIPGWRFTLLQSSQNLPASSDEVRILFVVDGGCSVTVGGRAVFLRKMDSLLLNAGEQAFLQMEMNTYAALLSVDYFELCVALGRTFARFSLNSRDGVGQAYAEFRFMMIGLLKCFLGNREKSRLQEKGLFCLILQLLVWNFLVPDPDVPDEGSKDALAFEIVQYVRLHFRSNLSMTDIAERFFLSRSATSKLFKRYTGETYPIYLKNLRLEAAKKDLERTDAPISSIGVENGFSTPSMFSQAFRERYGVTPKEYRDQSRKTRMQSELDEHSVQLILRMLSKMEEMGDPNTQTAEVVNAHTDRAEPWNRWTSRMVNVGPFSALQSASMQRQVLLLKKELGIQYLRMWSVFSSDLMIMSGKQGEFNFSTLDEIFDFCVDNGFRVFCDLSPRENRTLASETRVLFSGETRVSFESEEAWLAAVSALLRHIRGRYRDETVREWVFEIAFRGRDGQYYAAKDYSPLRVWEKTCACIREIFPDARIAGPGLRGGETAERLEQSIRQLLTSAYPPDIFTSIHFPYHVVGSEYEKETFRDLLSDGLARINTALERRNFQGEHWVTEWGISFANRNFLQDSCYRGATVAETMLQNLHAVRTIGMFYASDLLGVFSDSGSVLSGSGGLLSRGGLRKPAYYACLFLRQLGEKCVARTGNCIVTQGDAGDLRILCWNRRPLGPLYYMREEDSFRPEEIGTLFEDRNDYPMELVLDGLRDGGNYRIRQQILNEENGSVLDKWIGLGSVKDISREDVEYLEQISAPEITLEIREARRGELRLHLRLAPNEIRFITVVREH